MKKTKKILLILLICAIVGTLTLFGIDLYVKVSTSGDIFTVENLEDATQEYDCIVVLGAGLRKDGTPSPMLQERLDKGIELYKAGVSSKIIMSGDHEYTDHDEVNAMKDYAIKQGIPSNDIFMDHAGISTYDSMYRAKEIFGAKSVLVVTQKYHLYRAMYIGKSLGVNTAGVDAEKTKYSGTLYREVREILARVKDFFKCLIKPKSTYGGDEIPVFGDGNVTNDKEYITIRELFSDSPKEIYVNNKSEVAKIKNIIETYKFSEQKCDCSPDHVLTFNTGESFGITSGDSIMIYKADEIAYLNKEDSEFIKEILER